MSKFSNESVDSLTDKLQTFAEGLTDDERTALNTILAKAAQEDEVSGFDFSSVSSFNTGTSGFDPNQTRSALKQGLIGDVGTQAVWWLYLDDESAGGRF